MMAIIVSVGGFPRNEMTKGKLAKILKTTVLTSNKNHFWVAFIRGKKAGLKFTTAKEAEAAQQILQGYLLVHNNKEYVLTAEISTDWETHKSFEQEPLQEEQKGAKRKISSSPHDELSKVDIEIELVRKQRKLVEEERKLLLEQKKLDILKKLNTNDINQLNLFESVCDNATPQDIQEALSKSMKANTVPWSEMNNPNKDQKNSQLPRFFGIRRILFIQMRQIIDSYTTDANRILLRRLWNDKMRVRLASLLENEKALKPRQINILYRKTYPKSTDEDFVKECVKEIDMGLIAPDVERKDTNGQNDNKSDSDNKNLDEPTELNTELDLENDLDDWTEDDPKDDIKEDGLFSEEKPVEKVGIVNNIEEGNSDVKPVEIVCLE